MHGYQAQVEGSRAKYLPIAQSGLLTARQERDWLFGEAKLFVEAGIGDEHIFDAMAEIKLREGLRDCLVDLALRKVPVAVVSYGIADFVEMVLILNNIRLLVDHVYAMRFKRHKSGTITGLDRNTAVFPSTKGVCSLNFAKFCKVPAKRILAVGDSLGDRALGYLQENRFGIASDEQHARALRTFMGEVVVTKSFAPAHQWLVKKLEGRD